MNYSAEKWEGRKRKDEQPQPSTNQRKWQRSNSQEHITLTDLEEKSTFDYKGARVTKIRRRKEHSSLQRHKLRPMDQHAKRKKKGRAFSPIGNKDYGKPFGMQGSGRRKTLYTLVKPLPKEIESIVDRLSSQGAKPARVKLQKRLDRERREMKKKGESKRVYDSVLPRRTYF